MLPSRDWSNWNIQWRNMNTRILKTLGFLVKVRAIYIYDLCFFFKRLADAIKNGKSSVSILGLSLFASYRDPSCCFLQFVGTFRPLQSNHHLSAGTAWDSNGLSKVAPGISPAVSTTERGQEELQVCSCSSVDTADILCLNLEYT